MRYSFIIPVFNRPAEAAELLESLAAMRGEGDFEVVVVEDGSSDCCAEVVGKFDGRLSLKYVAQPNGGPAVARNNGAEHASGEFLLILDSDCVVPQGYLKAIDEELRREECDAFGGPDRAAEGFTAVQKAINYSMTSFLTTGGIRGGKRKLDRFYPRSFNMGVRRSLFLRLGGFMNMRFGEDIDLSIRIFESGARCRLFPEAWVWHKRRTDFRKFFRQVMNSGIARINLWKRHPGSLKPVHLLPALFTVGCALLLLLAIIGAPFCLYSLWLLLPLGAYALLVLLHSAWLNKSLVVALLSVLASYIQLLGYGTGFISAWWRRCVRGKGGEMQAFRNTFYK
ncbi:MAG: glycosyltransferase [Prevotellaceae bacterium]|nr:glycosyltransferase [Prevotellaceae bacterium]